MPGADSTSWRLIDTGPLDGATNMAIDEALLLSFARDTSCPLLRLYGWQPPALSLGRFQDPSTVLDLQRCRTAGVPLVRRITGGGVIFHADEVTYSIVCSPTHLPSPASIKESFRHLTAFLLRFYEKLGLHPRYAVDEAQGRHLGERTPFCFAGQESYDILVGGRKIGGNAQRRLKEAIFQHGSIPLRNRAPDGVAFMRDKPAGIGSQTISLADAEVTGDEEIFRALLAESFREAMGVALQGTPLSPWEQEKTEELLLKYCDDRWNLRGEV